MKSNSLDEIVKCTIKIANPTSDSDSLDSILLITPVPADGDPNSGVLHITKISDLEDYGYASTDDAYKALSVAFDQDPCPSEILLVEKLADETVTQTLTRAAGLDSFYGICAPTCTDNEDVVAIAQWAEDNEKLYGYSFIPAESGTFTTPLDGKELYRTIVLYAVAETGSTYAENATYAALAWMSKCFGYDPGSETWHMKELNDIAPAALSNSDKTTLEGKNITTFRNYAQHNVTYGGKVFAGEWIDVIRFRDWLKSKIQTAIFNVLRTNTKVPFTDAGINMITGSVESVLLEGQRVGGIAEDTYDDDGNAYNGYTITIPKAMNFTEAQRKARKLTDIKWTARLAGAIHAVEINGYLTF